MPDDRGYLSIGEVLNLLQPEFPDLSISKIRFLESQGLLDPERTPSGYRKFYDGDVERLRWILRQQREQYLPLKVIRGRLLGTGEGDEGEADEPESPDLPVGDAELDRHEPAASDEPAGEPPQPPRPAASRRRDSARPVDTPAGNPLSVGSTGVSMSATELAEASGLRLEDVAQLQRYGLITGRALGDETYFDEEALVVVRLAAGFLRHGVEPRHLRMYRTAAEREAAFFEQLVVPMLRQRNPRARQQATETLVELAKLGQGLRDAMLRLALRSHLGG